MLLSCFAAGCSALSPRTAVAASVLFVVLIGPFLTSALGLNVFESVSAKHLFSPALPEDLALISAWTFPAAALLFFGGIRWQGLRVNALRTAPPKS